MDAVRLERQQVDRYSEALLRAYLHLHQATEASLQYRGERIDYIRRIVAALDDYLAPSEYFAFIRVRTFDAPTPVAHVLPSGILLVSHPLVHIAGNEDALAGVLAHELAHLDLGHPLRIPRAMAYHGIAVEDLRPADWSDLIHRPFTLDDELAADASAVRWMSAAGWNPAMYSEYLLRRSKDHQFAQRWFPSHLAPTLFLSELKHPELGARLRALKHLGGSPRR